jgi:hypothetical protein
MQGHTTKMNAGRITCRVCIILNSTFAEAHKMANNKLIDLPENDQFEGRFLGATLHFNNYSNKGKKIKGTTKILLCPYITQWTPLNTPNSTTSTNTY